MKHSSFPGDSSSQKKCIDGKSLHLFGALMQSHPTEESCPPTLEQQWQKMSLDPILQHPYAFLQCHASARTLMYTLLDISLSAGSLITELVAEKFYTSLEAFGMDLHEDPFRQAQEMVGWCTGLLLLRDRLIAEKQSYRGIDEFITQRVELTVCQHLIEYYLTYGQSFLQGKSIEEFLHTYGIKKSR